MECKFAAWLIKWVLSKHALIYYNNYYITTATGNGPANVQCIIHVGLQPVRSRYRGAHVSDRTRLYEAYEMVLKRTSSPRDYSAVHGGS